MMAKSSKCRGRHSTLAPESSSTNSFSGAGNDRGDAGRSNPASGRSRMVEAATIPPVLPGEIKASARPSLSRSTARRIEQSFLRRNPSTGLSSMVRTSPAWTTLTRGSAQSARRRAAVISSSRPTRNKFGDAGIGLQGQPGAVDDHSPGRDPRPSHPQRFA